MIRVKDSLLQAAEKTYSGDTIPDSGKLRGVILIDGELYVSTGGGFQGNAILQIRMQRVIPRHQYSGQVYTYSEKVKLIQTDEDRAHFYEGMTAKCKGKVYVLVAPKLTLMPMEPAAEERQPEPTVKAQNEIQMQLCL